MIEDSHPSPTRSYLPAHFTAFQLLRCSATHTLPRHLSIPALSLNFLSSAACPALSNPPLRPSGLNDRFCAQKAVNF